MIVDSYSYSEKGAENDGQGVDEERMSMAVNIGSVMIVTLLISCLAAWFGIAEQPIRLTNMSSDEEVLETKMDDIHKNNLV